MGADDAIAAAFKFKNTALHYKATNDEKLAPHLKTAIRRRRPERDEGNTSTEKGHEFVKYYEDKGECRMSGVKLYWKRGNDNAEEKDDGKVVKAKTKKGANLIEEPMNLEVISQYADEQQAIKAFLKASEDRDWASAVRQRARRNRTALRRTFSRPSHDDEDENE